ncbi:flagellar hook-associated protein FlgL [Domibacillus epiphyticus]|uniref:Flagellar hook-associated protein FlgL n=1 Tax=Domibacillus epiphyticus TaxID=1714355 RepID=A0A1V2A480_9BACI|nr:flagellar hook-associated protein FlgL [Domibacillus epiphyticus]OMP65803.1 flagellar hook-associated protein FlgL [Domibacillus epiphyticus]
MRVTQSMLSSNMMKNLTASLGRLDKLNTQVASQKKITKPSDDPVVAMKGITHRRSLAEVEQFQRNFSEAYNWVENSDSAMDKAKLALDRIRELVVEVSNDTYDYEQRQAASEEIKQLKEHLVDIANTKFGEKYLFNGTKTTTPPFNPDGTVNGTISTAEVQIELSKDVRVPVNMSAISVFPTGAGGMFETINSITSLLDNTTTTGEDVTGSLNSIDQLISKNTTARAQMGARYNRIELMEARVAEQKVVSSRIMSENEDVDFEQVVTDLTVQETVHKAALSVASRIIQPTLMDYLR